MEMFYDIDKIIQEIAIDVLAFRYIYGISPVENGENIAQPFAIWFGQQLVKAKNRKKILSMLLGFEFESTKELDKLPTLINQLTNKDNGLWEQSELFKAVIPKLEIMAEASGMLLLSDEKLSNYISKT